MNTGTVRTDTSPDVLDYYSRNWEVIANCYSLAADGLPVDPAWYRRQLYWEFLERVRPPSVLDIGCGGGWTVLDALTHEIDARGIEPVPELSAFASRLLTDHGHDPQRVRVGDLADLAALPPASEACIALLSVLPHVPPEKWLDVHSSIAKALRPGGRMIAAYRNELFDLYTFNSFTVETFDRSLWEGPEFEHVRRAGALEQLKSLMTHPDTPGAYYTTARDKSFGNLKRIKSNPLAAPAFLARFGLTVDRIRFYHIHCVPPLLAEQVPEFRSVNHELEARLSSDWRGHFMGAMFLVEAIRD
jgi:SAM-dependent methyltransferase